jgi:hypothetical protein
MSMSPAPHSTLGTGRAAHQQRPPERVDTGRVVILGQPALPILDQAFTCLGEHQAGRTKPRCAEGHRMRAEPTAGEDLAKSLISGSFATTGSIAFCDALS